MQRALVHLDFGGDAGRRVCIPQRVLCVRVPLVVVGRYRVQHLRLGVQNQQVRAIVVAGGEPAAVERGAGGESIRYGGDGAHDHRAPMQ